MRPLLTLLLLFCLSATIGVAQTKKPVPKRKPATAPARRPATTRPVAPAAPVEAVEAAPSPAAASQPASLTFPSTEPEGESMDPVKKQQMYDELHGVKAKPNAPDAKGGREKAPKATKERTARESKRSKKGEADGQESRSGRMPAEGDGRASRSNSEGSLGGGDEAGSFIGIKAGGNYLTFLDAPSGTEAIYGFHAGVVAQFGKGLIGFQPEILFNSLSRNGITSNAIQVPLLARFQFGQTGKTRLFVNVGPYGSYSLDEGNDGVIEYGGALGLGVGIPMKSGAKLIFEVRGNYSLGDTSGESEFGKVDGSPILGQLSIGYLFPLGGR